MVEDKISITDCRVVYHGWRELYPQLTERILAWVWQRLSIFGTRTRYLTPRWFHTIFPFRISMRPINLDRALAAYAIEQLQLEGRWPLPPEYSGPEGAVQYWSSFDPSIDQQFAVALEPHVQVQYVAELIIPYRELFVGALVQPISLSTTFSVLS